MKSSMLRGPLVAALGFAVFSGPLDAQENVAQAKPARHSSGYNGPGQDQFPASLAVDGNLGNFQHTWAGQAGPAWWEVDLGAFYDISFIVVHNRGGGCCQSRHRDLTVQVLDFSGEGEAALYTSPLLNPENILGGGGTAGPRFITLNLLKLAGGPVSGTVVRVTRTPDPDLSGTGGQGNADEPYVLQLGEVEVFQGECPEAIGICSDLTLSGPANGGPGIYTASATGAGDPLYYTFTADNGVDPPMVFGPQEEALAPFPLTPGTWTISVAAGDSRLCPSEAPEAICTREVTVKDCSADPLDTRCDALTVQPPHGGNYPGPYRVQATATDDSQDVVIYTFSAENGVDPPLVIGPTESSAASFPLGAGTWTVTVKVRDNRLCPPDDSPLATCSQVVEVKTLSALPNVAPQGTASQSSEWPPPSFPARLAIDGNLNNFTHTASADDMATWEVDLGTTFSIEAIVLHNRRSCCFSRLRDLTVSILDFDGAPVWTSQLLNEENALGGGMATDGPPTLTLPLLELEGKPIAGRTVRVARAPDPDNSGAGFVGSLDESNVLSLAEVEVFAGLLELPAKVVRTLAKETFGSGEAVPVSLVITSRTPDVAVAVKEVLPPRATASDISAPGALNGNAIEWSVTVSGAATLSYKIAAGDTCAGSLRIGNSSYKVGGTTSGITGPVVLNREVRAPGLGAWQAADITASGGGSEALGDHDLLVTAAGEGMRATSDAFRFISRLQSGDFEVSARIDCVDDPAGTGQAGLMVRDTLDPFSAHAFFCLVPNPPGVAGVGTLRGFYRRETNALRATSPITIASAEREVAALPLYLKLKRSGLRIALERSADGVSYTEVGFRDIGTGVSQVNLRGEALWGIACASGGTGLARYTFAAVSGPGFSETDERPRFRRGDVDANGVLDVTDAVASLGYQFLGQPAPVCLDAADTDDSGGVDISDAISSLGYQFLGGSAPADPGPRDCGPDPTAEDPDLGCKAACR